jgi:hypothetical protein
MYPRSPRARTPKAASPQLRILFRFGSEAAIGTRSRGGVRQLPGTGGHEDLIHSVVTFFWVLGKAFRGHLLQADRDLRSEVGQWFGIHIQNGIDEGVFVFSLEGPLSGKHLV